MKFYYGIENNYLDITDKVIEKCSNDKLIIILQGDHHRTSLFTDPIVGTLKHIKYVNNDGNEFIVSENQSLFINKDTSNVISNVNLPRPIYWERYGKYIEDPELRLRCLHKYIKLDFGDFHVEYPEQLMAMKYLNENAKVLEIGGNIGRNSSIIGSILKNDKNLVVLESHPEYFNQLKHNKEQNSFNFNIENAALSVVPLIQNHWITKVSDEVLEGWIKVNTITFEELEKKYNIQFDTLVLDCEGAFYQILKDTPNCLDNINMVIIENDFHEIEKKQYVDEMFAKHNLKCVYVEAGGWGVCQDRFYEVYKKLN